MKLRQKTGSVVCASCGSLVGVNDEKCYTCGRRNPGLWGFGPVLRRFGNEFGFSTVIVYGCVAMYALSLVLTLLTHDNILSGSVFSILGPGGLAAAALGMSGKLPVYGDGRWWTLLSAGWLHAGALHILFNMMWVRQLGPVVEDLYGGARMIIIYTIACVAGFLLSSTLPVPFIYIANFNILSGSGYTLGASAPIFGLLGALVHYGRRGGSSLVGAQAMNYAVSILIFGLFIQGVDNAAHVGGFIGGYLASMWLDPLKRERMDHYIGAAICLLATLLAILASVITALPTLKVVIFGF